MIEINALAKHIVELAKQNGAEFVEVVVSHNEFSLKRIRQGQVDQPPAGEQWAIDLALVKGKRRKALSFDNPQFAESLIKETMGHIDLAPEVDIALPEQFPAVKQHESSYDPKTAELNDEHLINVIRRTNEKLRGHGLFLSGKIAQGRGEIVYANSLGTHQSATFTLATAAFFAFDEKDLFISAYSNAGGTSIDDIDEDRMVKELITKCELQRTAKRIDLFEGKNDGEELRYDVIVEPYFFRPIFEWLGFFGFNGLLVERGESFISGKLGQQVTGKNISISDDPTDSRSKGMGVFFDFEGRPRTKTELIKQGIAKNALYDTQLAKEWKKQATGHALPASARSEGAAPFNLVIEGGDSSIEQMVKEAKKPTLWITKLHYLGMKHYQTATMTGIAQHGVFLIENGNVTAPVENLRFEESIPEALKRVEAMSPSRLVFDPLSLSFPEGIVAPAMKIKDFRFVGSTKRST